MSQFSNAFMDYGTGRRTPVGGLEDDALRNRLSVYKAQVSKRYRVLEPDGLDKRLPPGALWVSTKVDGELWFLVKRKGEVALCAHNGRVIQGIPVVQEAEQQLRKADDIIIPGELFAATDEGRPRCYHVGKALGDGQLANTLGFKAFDLLEDGGEDRLGTPYEKRLVRLNELFDGGQRSGVVATAQVKPEEVPGYYNEWVATRKFEGLVVRSEQGLTYKVKPTFTLDAVVIAYGERIEPGVNGPISRIRELTLALKREDGGWHILGTVGGGFSLEDRVSWHQRLSQMQVQSAFRMANREGTLCRFVRPEIVVEVRCSDVVDTDASDAPVRRMVLHYDAGNGFSVVGSAPIASMVHPVFERERTDKLPDAANVGMEQIWSRLPNEPRAMVLEAVQTAASKVIEREVFTKVTKGQVAVRKYVSIQTNKAGAGYPEFVVHFTDFSAGRQEPLKTAIRVASSQDALARHIALWREENIKKGWNPAK